MSYELQTLPKELTPATAPSKPKPKEKKAMATVQAFAKFGVQAIRVKAQVLAALGTEAENCGIKKISHGRILLAADNAESAVSYLDGVAKDLLKTEKPDYPLVLEVMRLQKEFNSQLIKTAEAHFAVDKQPMAPAPPSGMVIPYPAGSAVMIGIGPPKSSEPPAA